MNCYLPSHTSFVTIYYDRDRILQSWILKSWNTTTVTLYVSHFQYEIYNWKVEKVPMVVRHVMITTRRRYSVSRQSIHQYSHLLTVVSLDMMVTKKQHNTIQHKTCKWRVVHMFYGCNLISIKVKCYTNSSSS